MSILSATRARALGGACVVVLTLAVPTVALACSCISIPFETEYAGTENVFTARSLGHHTAAPEYPDQHYETLQVQAIWKGSLTPIVDVLVPDNDGLCGMFLVTGADYLVFARESPGFPLFTHACSRTGIYAPGDPIWTLLGPPLTTPAEAASWGRVKAAYHR